MQTKAVARYVRISPLKVRKVARQLRGRNVGEVLALLSFMPNKSAHVLYKVLFSARANFVYLNPDISTDALEIAEVTVDEGPSFARWLPRARGRADRLHKRTAHVSITVVAK